MALSTPNKLQEMISLLDDAVAIQEQHGCCKAVKEALEKIVGSGEEFLEPRFLQPVEGRYARRLVHKDPNGTYTVLAMVWDKGQGTPLHDHDHRWCVECVYRGEIKVVSYSLQGNEDDPVVGFERETEVIAGIGDAGALIPPFEYHTIETAAETPAVTLHVYSGEMDHCNIFVPTEGGYKRETRQLSYTP